MLLLPKNHKEESVFKPANLMREARRQKGVMEGRVPSVCVLDPDGDIVDFVLKNYQARPCAAWACYHTSLLTFQYQGVTFGIIGRAVGASFAVLLAEQLFVSGCKLLISITSAGIINPPKRDSRFILIQEALRDEGTSYHYLPADEPACLSPDLGKALLSFFQKSDLSVEEGYSWTTDAPYRETQAAIESARGQGVSCVEMESAALYAFAKACGQQIVCYAHLTNTMAQEENDFEKGEENGSLDSLTLLVATVNALQSNLAT
ncbi:MAG: nucleoside phosphorylase [Bacteroidetes bacterium]|nr:nucleoside phosphorylase [Bacteroidota bacterium]